MQFPTDFSQNSTKQTSTIALPWQKWMYHGTGNCGCTMGLTRLLYNQACVNTVFVHKLKQEGIEIALLVSHWLIFLTNQQTKVLAPNYNPK